MTQAERPQGRDRRREKGLHGFSERERIKKGTEIRGLLGTGSSVGCRGMKLVWKRSENEVSRMAIALRRGYGTAVRRNYAKRLIRESFRDLKTGISGKYDMVFVVFPGYDDLPSRHGQMTRLFRDSGLVPRAKA